MAIVSAVSLGPLLIFLISGATPLSDSCISSLPIRNPKTRSLSHQERFALAMDLGILIDVMTVYDLHFSSHPQEIPVDLEVDASPYSPPRAFIAGCVVPGAFSSHGLHRAVVPFRTAPTAGAGGPAVNHIEVDCGRPDVSLCSGHCGIPPATFACATDISPETRRFAFFPV